MERNDDKIRSRAIVVRCSDPAFIGLLNLIRSSPDCYLVFTKSSCLRLVVMEEAW